MNPSTWIVGGAFVGVLASMWGYLQGAAWKILNCFVQYIDIGSMHYETTGGVVNYLLKHYKLSPVYDRRIEFYYMRMRSNGKHGKVAVEKFGEHTLVFWNGWRPIIYYVSKSTESNPDRLSNPSSKLIYLRGTIDHESLLREATNQHNQLKWDETESEESRKDNDRYFIIEFPKQEPFEGRISYDGNHRLYRHDLKTVPISCRHEDVGPNATKFSKLESLFYPEEVMKEIHSASLWIKSREFYQSMGIPHKRGWLLYGPPGTGKSALADAVAHDLNMPIFVFRLSDMTNTEFMKSWKSILANTPCVALLEDIDTVFHGRRNISENDGFSRLFSTMNRKDNGQNGNDEIDQNLGRKLNFQVLLNCIDGVDRSEGVLTIITTNDLSKIDDALGQPTKDGNFVSTRPGRIDKALHLTYMEQGVKEKMARHLLSPEKGMDSLLQSILQDLVDDPRQETPAQFQERIGQLALKEHWKIHD